MSPCMGQVKNTNQLAAQVVLIGRKKENIHQEHSKIFLPQVNVLQNQVSNLQTRAAGLQRTTNGNPTTANPGTEVDAVADYVLTSGTKCGPQTITGWTRNVDWTRVGTTVTNPATTFNTGTGLMTPPKNGWYHICAYSRFQNSGNAVEMCLRKGTTRIACYGNAVQFDWRSTGVCTNQVLSTTDSVSLSLESGGGSDCVQETGWLYNRISMQLIQQNET